MKPVSLRSTLLVLIVVSAVARPLGAAPPAKEPEPPPLKESAALPLKEVTQEKIRAWAVSAVAADRKLPDKAEFWKELDPLIAIDPDKIVYEHDKGVPVKLVWDAAPRRALNAEERVKAEKGLNKVYEYALFEHDKGLVAGPDAKLLKSVTHLEVGPNPGKRKHPAKVEAAPLKELTEEKVQDWAAVAIDALRADADWADFWKEMDPLIAIDPDKIVYESDKEGRPVKLAWEATPRRELTAEERLKAQAGLSKLAQHVFFKHDKGLVGGPDMDAIKSAMHLEIGADATTVAKEPTPPAKEPTTPPAKEPTTPDKEPTTPPAKEPTTPPVKEPIPPPPAKVPTTPDKEPTTPPAKEPTTPPAKEPTTPPAKEPTLPPPIKEPTTLPLKEVNQEKVRAWAASAVNALRTDADWTGFWKKMDQLVVIDPNQIVYESDNEGRPVKLGWRAAPRRELTPDERLEAQEGLRKLAQHVFFKHNKGLVSGPDVEALSGVLHVEIDVVVSTAKAEGDNEECKRLRLEVEEQRRQILELKELVVHLKVEASAPRSTPPASPPGPSTTTLPAPRFNPVSPTPEGQRYVMMVQPSSMIYYDCCSHCWLPGPSSVVYYPAGVAEASRSQRREPYVAAPPISPLPAPTLVTERRSTEPESIPGPSDDAERVFWVGYRNYWQGNYDRALASFGSAVRIDGQDARFWYYQALAQRALGDAVQAEASAQHGRELHAAHKPTAERVSAALERVQGAERRFLNAPEIVVSDVKNER